MTLNNIPAAGPPDCPDDNRTWLLPFLSEIIHELVILSARLDALEAAHPQNRDLFP